MRESSPISQLGKRERIGNQKVTCVLTLLVVLTAWISLTGFDQPLIAANIITSAYGQQESLSSETSTPFLEWYQTQSPDQQVSNPSGVRITSPEKGHAGTCGPKFDCVRSFLG